MGPDSERIDGRYEESNDRYCYNLVVGEGFPLKKLTKKLQTLCQQKGLMSKIVADIHHNTLSAIISHEDEKLFAEVLARNAFRVAVEACAKLAYTDTTSGRLYGSCH
jgi:hypothetical protein